MAKNLLIVESPAKAKTIEKILGSDFEVKSSFGHVRDLMKEDMGIDIENGFEPKYIISEDKEKVVSELKKLAKKADEVWLATDEDREGEAISWHLCEVLNLDPKTTKRIVFHEITKPAIKKAVENPRLVNLDLVNAQQARRILDRIVGFEISPILWRKMSMRNNLSAGRVQSVAVKLIAEREREIAKFKADSLFKVDGVFTAPDINKKLVNFKAVLPESFKVSQDAKNWIESCLGASYKVKNIQVKPGKRSPSAPFTTSTLQQEASRKLGYSVSRTMQIAQRLYESGHISYMRTDSVNLSDTALTDIKTAISNSYGDQYHQLRKFKNKNESAQEAHEAIRPTDMSKTQVPDAGHQSLYQLIWKRTMASQMADAQIEKTIAQIEISTNKDYFEASGEVIKFEGFLRAYSEGNDDEDDNDGQENMLPPLAEGQILSMVSIKAIEKYSRPAARYTEASLVKKLEELGIGRPSTYAPTISTILQRGYVEKQDRDALQRSVKTITLTTDQEIVENTISENYGAEKGKLFPTDLGLVVTDFLAENFQQVMDYSFTAQVEQQFDQIAQGELEYSTMLNKFYQPFHEQVQVTMEQAGRIKGEHELGIDPESGKPVIARLGRFGPMIQIGGVDDEEKPKFATLKKSQSIETITLEEALDLFKLPLNLGEYEGKEVQVNNGRFGPYVKWGDQFISLPKGKDPLEVDIETAISVIEDKKAADAPIGTYEGHPVTKGTGRFGPYIKWLDLFINVPKRYDFNNLSDNDLVELISAKVTKEANRYIHNWPEEKISIENGRWGPFIKFGKKMYKLPKDPNGEKYSAETLQEITLEAVKSMITAQDPEAFAKKSASKKASSKKSTAPKKTTAKKTATKSTGKKS